MTATASASSLGAQGAELQVAIESLRRQRNDLSSELVRRNRFLMTARAREAELAAEVSGLRARSSITEEERGRLKSAEESLSESRAEVERARVSQRTLQEENDRLLLSSMTIRTMKF